MIDAGGVNEANVILAEANWWQRDQLNAVIFRVQTYR